MDELPNSGFTAEPAAPTLQQQYDSLRQLVTSMLILLLIVSGTLNIFLWRQYRYINKDLENFRPMAANVINGYNKGDGPAIDQFVRNIGEYGRTHPDIEPILTKYGIKPTTATPPATAPANPHPTALPPAKK